MVWYHLYVESEKHYKLVNIEKEADSYMENKLVVPSRELERGGPIQGKGAGATNFSVP